VITRGIGDRRQRRGQRPLGVVGDDVTHEKADRAGIGERVEPPPADELTDLAVDDVQSARQLLPQISRTAPHRHGL
jgi:hypothetical protein